MQRAGHEVQFTYQANPGEVWEEGEFWIEGSWHRGPRRIAWDPPVLRVPIPSP
jgi:hypothetical protein